MENSTVMSFSRSHDPVTHDNPQTLLLTVSSRNYFISNKLHLATFPLRRMKHACTHGEEAHARDDAGNS